MAQKVLWSLLLIASASTATRFDLCRTNVPPPERVDVIGCLEPPCNFFVGSAAVMNITFTVPHFTTEVRPRAIARGSGFENGVNYPMVENGCNKLLNGYCPLEKDEVIVYGFSLSLTLFPAIPVNVEFSLVDDKKAPFACFQLDIQLLPKP